MTTPELDAHTIEQDRQDQLEEDRLRPIRQAQADDLLRFEGWLNRNHPTDAPFVVKIPKYVGESPWIEGLYCGEMFFEGETCEPVKNTPATWLVLWALFQSI